MTSKGLTKAMVESLRYAERNHGRNFVTELADEPNNVAINHLTSMGLFRDGGPSTFGRWRVLTPAGRAALTHEPPPQSGDAAT